jgi:hypothetical protein
MSPEIPKTLRDILSKSQGLPVSQTFGTPTSTGETLSQLLNLSSLSPPAQPPPPVINDRWFKDQTIYLDGYTFERCRFDGCTLVISEATFSLKRCFIAPNCRLFFTGRSLKVARLLLHTMRIQGRIQMLAGEEGVFAAMGTDGTFTVD